MPQERQSSSRLLYSIFDVPHKVRPAWVRDSWAGFMAGIYLGGLMSFVLVVARKELHAGAGLIGLMSAAPYFGMLLALFAANAMEGRPKMPFVIGSIAIGRGLLFLLLFITTPVPYAIVVSVSQMLITTSSPAYASIMQDIYPASHRARLMGYVRVIIALANILATLAVGRMLSGSNYRWIFPIAALSGVISALIFGAIRTSPPLREEVENRRKTYEFLRDALRLLRGDKRFLRFIIAMFVFGFGNLLLLPVYPIFQVDRLHYGPREVAVFTMVYNVVWMLSYFYWGRYIDETHPMRAVLINVLMTLLVPLSYVFAGTMDSPSVVVLFPAAICMAICAAGTDLSYFNAVIHFGDAKLVPTYMALFTFLLGVRGGTAPFLGAAAMRFFNVHHWDMSYLFTGGMIIMFAGMILQVASMRRDDIC